MPQVKSPRSRRTRHRFGVHCSIAGGMHRALQEARRLGCDAVQVFVKNQRQWQAAPLKPDDVDHWFALRANADLGPLMAHATYLINLAAADRTIHRRSCDAFTEELRRCDALDIAYLVVHPGSATGSTPEEGLARVARTLNEIFSRDPQLRTQVLLETTAGQGANLGHRLEELAEIITRVEEPARVGVCVDSCHVFAAGYNICDATEYQRFVDNIERTVGLARVRCWHLNDSKQPFASRRDRHAHIGHGHIATAGFRNILADERFTGLPMVLETPKETDESGREWDKRNLQRLRQIAARAAGKRG